MRVNIGVLKNELSHYLHKVRDGEEITVTDRNEPVARIIPLRPLSKTSKLRDWIEEHPPIKLKKKQSSSLDTLRQMRDEDER